jgi:hypothetical protein
MQPALECAVRSALGSTQCSVWACSMARREVLPPVCAGSAQRKSVPRCTSVALASVALCVALCQLCVALSQACDPAAEAGGGRTLACLVSTDGG